MVSSPRPVKRSYGCLPDLSRLRDSLLGEGPIKAGNAATPGEVCSRLGVPKDLDSSLSFFNLLYDPVQVAFSLGALISSLIKGESLVDITVVSGVVSLPKVHMLEVPTTPATLECDLIWR